MVKILDTTLRDGLLNSIYNPSETDKQEIARILSGSGIDIIEIGHIIEGAEIDSIIELGKAAKGSEICVLSDFDVSNMETALRVLENFPGSRLHLYSNANVPEDESHQSVFAVGEAMSFVSLYIKNIQWTAFDGGRADFQALKDQIEMAVDCGAKTVSIPDSFGTMSPDEYSSILNRVKAEIPSTSEITLSSHCHDDTGHALENSIAAFEAGFDQIECTLLGAGARKGNCNLLELLRVLDPEKKHFDKKLLDSAGKIMTSSIEN